mmetsp:Transcript_3693/g.7086  ORF Transcript_3693/g.7086 Transcript_3693/m.7086 type:complete len:84 (-) Transcript_3693:65-316(-)
MPVSTKDLTHRLKVAQTSHSSRLFCMLGGNHQMIGRHLLYLLLRVLGSGLAGAQYAQKADTSLCWCLLVHMMNAKWHRKAFTT